MDCGKSVQQVSRAFHQYVLQVSSSAMRSAVMLGDGERMSDMHADARVYACKLRGGECLCICAG